VKSPGIDGKFAVMKREEAISVLNKLRPALEARGVVHAGLFGSVARGEAGSRSDVDVVVTFGPGARMSLINMGGVQTVLEEGFGCDVDVVVEPIAAGSLRSAIERDRMNAF
jgi:uncharacterized protein